MEIILIAAMAANRVIGYNNTIPWDIPGEQTRFKEITMGCPLILGRKTWQAIGRPLPGRRNIVVSRNKNLTAEGGELVHSLHQAFALCRGEEKVFIIGGAQLYSHALDRADTLILTVLDLEVKGDTFFPDFTCPPFALMNTESVVVENTSPPVSYSIQTYQRKEQGV